MRRSNLIEQINEESRCKKERSKILTRRHVRDKVTIFHRSREYVEQFSYRITRLSRTSTNKFSSWLPRLTTTATLQRNVAEIVRAESGGKKGSECPCPPRLSVLSRGERKNLPSRPTTTTGTKVRRAARRVERVVGRFYAITSFRFSKPACWSRVKEHVCGTAIKY